MAVLDPCPTSTPGLRMEATGFSSLGEMRWHATANPDNPDRVSYAEYARQTGIDRQVVRMSVVRFLTSADVKAAPPVDNRGGSRVGPSGTTDAARSLPQREPAAPVVAPDGTEVPLDVLRLLCHTCRAIAAETR
jgi:hypothetical protein